MLDLKIAFRKQGLKEEDGIIVGCTQDQEWLLPFFWMNYHLYNSYPVCFMDFGMSEKAKAWCAQRGELFSCEVSEGFIVGKDKVAPKEIKIWEETYSQKVWKARLGWFKKPFAFLHSPYKRAIWLDLDCQVNGSLSPLFDRCENPSGIAMAEDPDFAQQAQMQRGLLLFGEISYNSGVVVFRREAPLLRKWVEACLKRNDKLMGDQQVLCRLIFEEHLAIGEFSKLYNWQLIAGKNDKAIVLHWIGGTKQALQKLIDKYALTNKELLLQS